MTLAVLAIAILYGCLTVVQFRLAWRYFAKFREARCEGDGPDVTVLQAILSGDPDLEASLGWNLAANPAARFLWLVDDDDLEGIAIAGRLATARVTILTGPGPRDETNPKLEKLARALPFVTTPIAVVLDDDTVIDSGALSRLAGALDHADLVTGLPVFVARRTWFERLVGGFVNGNAILTYLPAASSGIQRTINGMIYAFRTGTLRGLGGFETVLHHLTDDYAVAGLFERNGKRLFQAPVFVDVTMTIRSARHYGRVMRRWLIFANRYLGENAGSRTLLLVGLPAMLPPAGLVMAAMAAWWAAPVWIACLVVKAVANRRLLNRLAGRGSGVADVVAEVLASLLLPFFFVSALIRPGRLTWRTRRIELADGVIRYR